MGKFASIRSEGNIPHWSETHKDLIGIIPSKRDLDMADI
jgi:hypothetical protein